MSASPTGSTHLTPARPAGGADEYVVGVMTMDVEGKDSDRFRQRVERATQAFEASITEALGVRVDLLAFEGPHLTPAAGAYAPLDFLQIGLAEKLERGVHFLLIVTEVDLAAPPLSYTLALPSQLTNVAVLSTKRLDPGFWGDDEDEDRTVQRLTALQLHAFGHLLNLSHSDRPGNAMGPISGVDGLEDQTTFSDRQREQMRRRLPREAHERTSRRHHGRFVLQTLARDAPSIASAVARANPFRLATRLPTMVTAALSVLIVVFLSPEMWAVASTGELSKLL